MIFKTKDFIKKLIVFKLLYKINKDKIEIFDK